MNLSLATRVSVRTGVVRQSPQTQVSDILIRTLRHILGPIVRLMVTHQISLSAAVELMKRLFVQAAEAELRDHGAVPSDSRIHIMTGVHRKDVRRLRRAQPEQEITPVTVSVGAQVVARWTGDARYLDKSGRPRPLLRSGRRRGLASFHSLVDSISRHDVHPNVVLEELLRLGIVSVDEKDCIHLQVDAFVPDKGFEEKAFYVGQNVRDHMAAAAHNLSGVAPPFLERCVYYSGLGAAAVARLTRLAHSAGMRALQSVNREALRLRGQQTNRQGARQRINFGVYFFSEEKNPRRKEP